jgi:hypothetical protein
LKAGFLSRIIRDAPSGAQRSALTPQSSNSPIQKDSPSQGEQPANAQNQEAHEKTPPARPLMFTAEDVAADDPNAPEPPENASDVGRSAPVTSASHRSMFVACRVAKA